MKQSCIVIVLLAVLASVAAGGQREAQIEEVSFVAECDGTKQSYVLLLPADFRDDTPHDLLIALHGHGSDRWQFIKENRDETRAVRDIAAEYRMILVSPDYRARTSWMGPKAEADVVQIIGDLKRQYRIRKVIICGGSMGGSACLTFAVRHPDLVDGVASMNGTANHLEYDHFQEAIEESFGGRKDAIPMEYKNRSAEYWPERLTMPVGITAGGKDMSVPPHSVLRLANVLKQINRRVHVIYREQGGHSTTYDDAREILKYAIGERPRATSPSSQ